MEYLAFAPRPRMDPPPRSFAPDAHACIMVLVWIDQPNTSLRRDIASKAGLASEVVLMPPTASPRPDLKPAAGLATVKGCVASRWPAATLDRRCARRPIKARSGRGDGRHLWVEQGDGKDQRSSLTIIAPYKVFGCRPMMTAPRAPGPASANLQWRKPREGIRQAVQRELIIGCRTYFRFRSRAIFEEPRPRMRAQLWRYGTSIAKWGK
ncbi:MAG: hypothetical protein QOJ58_2352 [Alphaproteobacteria bacterium]|nr:hypothetical protein [Alphaproteobacteria bacterium]